MADPSRADLFPGCWCGCLGKPRPGRKFLPGHDRTLVFRIIMDEYGSVEAFALRHGHPKMTRKQVRAKLSDLRRQEAALRDLEKGMGD